MPDSADPTRSLQDQDDATLENFLSRPLKIAEFEWSTASPSFFQSFDPWSLYFENPRVINRMVNFKLLKAKLHVKFVINGNSFQYGRLLASYLPLRVRDDLTQNRLSIPQDAIGASQLPHVFLDPTLSQGGDLVCPMFWNFNYLDIPGGDWSEMGEIVIRSLNNLKHANGAVDVNTISVFAWAEDVQMSILTSNEPGALVPQGLEVNEANTSGVVSHPASIVAKIAKGLSTVPYIGPFAMATDLAATAVGRIATLFGYSRPNITKAPDIFLPRPVGNLATTNTPDNAHKLTVDDMQELTIDTSICGIDCGDPLAIRSISTRESYLTKFSWSIGAAPESMLWNARVSPVVWDEFNLGNREFHFPACAVAALPFKYWTGTMKYRFQIVSSGFHKGRLKFVYDPDYIRSNEYNTNYLHVIDIAETKDFSIEIGNGQIKTLLGHDEPGLSSYTNVISTTPYASTGEGNGVLGVYIVNELTTPNSTVNNDIEINVFVSTGDDFEVFVPYQHFQNYVFHNQALEAEDKAEASNVPVMDSSSTLGPDSDTITPLVNKVYTGEVIQSFRQLLKRYNIHTAFSPASPSAYYIHLEHAMFPFFRGNVPNAVHTRAGVPPEPYNFCNTVLLHWVTSCFSGWRGSLRYKVVPRGARDADVPISMSCVRWDDYDNAGYAFSSGSMLTYTSNEGAAASVVFSEVAGQEFRNTIALPSPNGQALAVGDINPCLEYEIPFYSDQRFVPGKTSDYTGNFTCSGAALEISGDGTPSTVFDHYVAAGEDFQVFFWTGMPPLFYEATVPTPT
jgi:hypothetical protein